MANSATVGSAVIKLTFDGKGVKAQLDGVSREFDTSGKKGGTSFGNAWSVAVGNIISTGVGKVVNLVNQQMSDAVYRADTLERFPKVMEMMGYNANDAAGAVEKLRKGVEEIPTSLADVVAGTQRIAALTGDVDKAADWTMAISDAMLVTTGDVNEASRGMHQFIQMLSRGKPIGDDWNTIMEVASPIMNKLAESMGYTGAEMGSEFYLGIQKGKISINDLMDAMVKLDKEGGAGISALSDQVRTATGGIGSTITLLRQSVSNAIVAMIQDIGADNIKAAIVGIKDALVGLVKTIGSIVSFISSNWSWLQPILITIGAFAGTILAINQALQAYKAIKTAVNAVELAGKLIWQNHPIFMIASIIAGIIAALTVFFTQTETGKQIIQGFGETISTVFGAIGEFVSGVWNTITEGAQNAWNFITGLFSGMAGFFGSIFGSAWEAVKNVFSTGGQIFMGIVDGITNAFRTIVNAIITGINHVVAIPFNAINGFLSFLKGIDIMGLKPFDWVATIDVPQIPTLAQGGIANGATQAVIGEAGKEAVLPLENNTDNWAGLLASTLVDEMEAEGRGFAGVTIEKQEFVINNQLDAEDIGRVMMQSIRRAA